MLTTINEHSQLTNDYFLMPPTGKLHKLVTQVNCLNLTLLSKGDGWNQIIPEIQRKIYIFNQHNSAHGRVFHESTRSCLGSIVIFILNWKNKNLVKDSIEPLCLYLHCKNVFLYENYCYPTLWNSVMKNRGDQKRKYMACRAFQSFKRKTTEELFVCCDGPHSLHSINGMCFS